MVSVVFCLYKKKIKLGFGFRFRGRVKFMANYSLLNFKLDAEMNSANDEDIHSHALF